MKFYDIVYADSGFDLTFFEKYIFKGSIKKGYVIIKFDSSEINDVISVYQESFVFNDIYPEMLRNLSFFASDGFIYTDDGEVLINTNQFGFFKFIRILSVVKSRIRKSNKARLVLEKKSKIYSYSTFNNKRGYSKFKSFEFYNKENNICYNFRIKRAKSVNQPLVVFMAGGGCHGYDNFKPLYEYYTHLHKQLKNYDCSILIPQSPCSSNFISPSNKDYISSVVELTKEISVNVNADINRIYLIGTSFGGWCTWNMIYNSPDMFACGIPVMGCFLNNAEIKGADFERFRKTPFWIAHSSDDDNVPVTSDDYCFDRMKEIGIEAKYTRWDKYGHKMCNRFYKSEPWAEWMFDKKKQ